MKTLPPQVLLKKDYMPTAVLVFQAFEKLLFKPLLDVAAEYNSQLKDVRTIGSKLFTELKNESVSPLMAALRTGIIQYKDGIFSGKFSRAISSGLRHIGARFDERTGTYRLKDSEVPAGIKSEATIYQVNAKSIHETILRKLNEIQDNLAPTMELFDFDSSSAIAAVEQGFEKSKKSLAIMPELTEASRNILREEYSENMKLSIQKFTEETIKDLREKTEENATAGYRFDRLAEIIQDRYKVSATKAEFLARQETSLFMSEFRKNRFSEAGITRYIWRTSGKPTVRHDHKALNGRTFFYSDPPIVDKASGRRRNPGQDYGCQCIDEPVLDPVAVGT